MIKHVVWGKKFKFLRKVKILLKKPWTVVCNELWAKMKLSEKSQNFSEKKTWINVCDKFWAKGKVKMLLKKHGLMYVIYFGQKFKPSQESKTF